MTVLLSACGTSTQQTSPPPAAHSVYVTSIDNTNAQRTGIEKVTVTALDSTTGRTRWQHQGQWDYLHLPTAPVVAGGLVYVLDETNLASKDINNPPTGTVTALQASDGKQIWQARIGVLAAQPVVAGNVLYISAHSLKTGDTVVYALDAATGKALWHTSLGTDKTSGAFDTLVLAGGTLYMTSNQFCFDYCQAVYLLALRASDGTLLWHVSETGGSDMYLRPATIVNGVVYTSVRDYPPDQMGGDTALLAYDAANGTRLWQLPTHVQGFGGPADTMSPVVANGLVYAVVNTASNTADPNAQRLSLEAVDARTGAMRWRGPDTSAPVVLGVYGDTVLVQGRMLGSLLGISASDGRQRWNARAPALIAARAVDGVLYGVTRIEFSHPSNPDMSRAVAAIRLSDGKVLWTTTLTEPDNTAAALIPFANPFAIGDGLIITVPGMHTLAALNTADGHTAWQASLTDGAVASLTLGA